MCGIVGIFDTQGTRTIDPALLARLNGVHVHRGPDGGDQYIEPGIGLGHRRLAIIDLATGHQPLFNEDGTVGVVFNGEIYNFQELRQQLRARGHRFSTASDTEVIVHGWEEWGEQCLDRLSGMFAFALWDQSAERLFLARDRLGVKPLYYTLLPDGMLVFGSELKALMAHPQLSRGVDPCAVEEYFAFGYVPDPRTIFRGAFKLPPGHALSVARRATFPAPRQYWNISFERQPIISARDAQAELVDRLRNAVGSRLIADVPLGAFLSGGIDSSAVVAMMADLCSEPVTTCSIAFAEASYDESAYAAAVSAHFHTRHHVQTVDSEDLVPLNLLAYLYDEPFADSSAIPTYWVSQLARRRVTVALSGDGGDESLAGYRRYQWHLGHESWRSALPAFLRGPLSRGTKIASALSSRWPGLLPGQLTLASLSGDVTTGYLELISAARASLRRRLFSATLSRDLQGYSAGEVLQRHRLQAPRDSALSHVQYLDLKTYLPGDVLTKVDRASMAHGLEVRSPFLDHTLVEWICGLPPEWKLCNGESKHLLKRALGRYLPADVLNRPKCGFGVPIAEWLRGPLRLKTWNILHGALLNDTGFFQGRVLQSLMREHESGRQDHSAVLWSVLMFDAFLRRAHCPEDCRVPALDPRVA